MAYLHPLNAVCAVLFAFWAGAESTKARWLYLTVAGINLLAIITAGA